ncbi:MAG: hypothetical protein WC516_00145 [Patescibacteria group bacterium]
MNINISKISSARPLCANGYILLISVVVIGAIATSIAVALLWFGSADSQNAISHRQSEQAKALVNACAEEALQQIRTDTSYLGNGSLSLADGSCVYLVSGSVPNKLIVASSTVANVVRRVNITVSAVKPVITANWQEVP